MSVRANIATTYKVEYKGGSYFSNSQDFVETIMSSLEGVLGKNILFNSQLNDDGCGTWEFSRHHLDSFIDYVEKNKRDVINLIKKSKDSCFFMDDESDEDLYVELLGFLKALKDEGDKANDYVIVSWF